jgi:hypothetical protein
MANTSISAEIISGARYCAEKTGDSFEVSLAKIFGEVLFSVDDLLTYFEENVPEDAMGSLEFRDVFLGYVERFLNKKEF